jgi:hypothetical protein
VGSLTDRLYRHRIEIIENTRDDRNTVLAATPVRSCRSPVRTGGTDDRRPRPRCGLSVVGPVGTDANDSMAWPTEWRHRSVLQRFRQL